MSQRAPLPLITQPMLPLGVWKNSNFAEAAGPRSPERGGERRAGRSPSRFIGPPPYPTGRAPWRSPTLSRPWPRSEHPRTRSASRSSAPARPASTPPSTCSSATTSTVEVDMFDRLPTPFGLVRAGVAPDHPKIKSVIRVYEKTAAREGFRFFGNVDVGARRHRRRARGALPRGRLRLRHGHRPPARDPGRGPARLARGHRVRQLVQRPPRLRRPRVRPLELERAVVIGNGNVAADVARMLALPRAELDVTDTADHAIEAPRRARGSRRSSSSGAAGPAQAAFTNPEVRELGELTDADIVIDPAEMELDDAEPRVRRVRGLRPDPPAQRRDLHRVLRPASPRASRSGS